jgi:hypothetical protein
VTGFSYKLSPKSHHQTSIFFVVVVGKSKRDKRGYEHTRERALLENNPTERQNHERIKERK